MQVSLKKCAKMIWMIIRLLLRKFFWFSTILVQYDWNRQQLILSLDFWIYACQQSYMLYEFCIRSQNIVEEHETLLEALESNHTYLYQLEEPFMKKMIKRLDKFTGFTAMNYFSLNKSLLTSIIANFLTYFIVLIQFGISASPSDAIVPNYTNNTSGWISIHVDNFDWIKVVSGSVYIWKRNI